MIARITVATANVGRLGTPREAANNIRRTVAKFKPRPNALEAFLRPGASIGWQEIDEADPGDEHGELHETVREVTPGTEWAGFATAVPITIPAGWHVIERRIDRTCPGKPKATPARMCVSALIEHEKTGIRFVRLNGHYPLPRLAGWHLWEVCHQSWRSIVDDWLDYGYTIVATRDRNLRGGENPLSPFQRELLPKTLIDRITVIQAPPGPRAVQVVAGKPRGVNLTIDGHNAHGVPLTLVPLPKR